MEQQKRCIVKNLQQHHPEELNVLEGSGPRRFAAAFHHKIYVYITAVRDAVRTDRMPPICSLLPSLHHSISLQLKELAYTCSREVHTATYSASDQT